MFIACEELRNLAKSCRCSLHESDDFDSIIEEYSRLYYPCTGTPTDKVHFEFKLKEAKAIYDALAGEVTAAISCCLKDIRDALTDKRSEIKIIYPLDVMVTVILLARLCGNLTAAEVVNFYRARNLELQYLISGMPRPRYRLSESTVNCVMRMFSPEEINLLLGNYFSAVKTALSEMIKAREQRERPALAAKDTISFDGQEIVSSYRKGENSRRKKGAVGVSVYNSTKNNEAAAFLSLLPNLDIRGTIVMSDALNSLSEVSAAILRHGADYLFCIKDYGGNKELRGHIEAIFNREYAKKEKSAAISRYLCEKGHGRIDETLLETLPASLIDERIENPHQGINTIVKYTKTRTYLTNGKINKITTSSRYYVCSLVFSANIVFAFGLLGY
ncbi:ISAs1 family transposase [Succinatimonas hippei]|uniref:ISAs1 family transposase n=1 Tax=Succinatimonas hippei TaxID=626938 RepID=UPI0026EFFB11|nr:ISAs1 family transposase [Succinatimonas hippei]